MESSSYLTSQVRCDIYSARCTAPAMERAQPGFLVLSLPCLVQHLVLAAGRPRQLGSSLTAVIKLPWSLHHAQLVQPLPWHAGH